MAAPGSGIKFLGLDSALVDLAEKKSTLSNNKQEYFTASDIANGITAFDNGIVINETGADSDTRIEGQSDANLFFVDASTDRVGIGTNTPAAKLHVSSSGSSHYLTVQSTTLNNAGLRAYNTVADWRYICNSAGDLQIYDQTSVSTPLQIKQGAPNYSMYFATTEVIINQNAANLDFRVEGQTDSNLFFADASTDRVGVGTSTPVRKFHVDSAGANNVARVENSGSTASFVEFKDSATITNPYLGSQGDALVGFAGGNRNMYSIGSITVVNIDNNNHDFRIEGQTDTNLFFTDASTDRVGIGTNTPQSIFHINSSSSNAQRWQRSANIYELQMSGTANGILGVYEVTTAQYRLQFDKGNQILGHEAALATTATDGFTYIPTCAGTPTGTPTAYTGKVPMVYDTTNSIMYVYTGGAWTAV